MDKLWINEQQEILEKQKNIPKCPICGSVMMSVNFGGKPMFQCNNKDCDKKPLGE